MKKMIIMLLLSFFMLDTYAATAHLQQDTLRRKKTTPMRKRNKRDTMRKDSPYHRRDTMIHHTPIKKN
ncbi:hypothetical protein [Mucilaginibacter sp. L3T2-6]|uniref:hypothetical protein n=1 Tax=Mucilaginibacter sp. L3T2-6 TaxID=3062491 RepID=UPI00267485B6|nr:hypothetical protein [Mucilaginibacter sp. L3T2-6]MDO3644204.1 hypothetical protein [Mucilaginibacter sp. L3T2-6]MDV6216699.1 hypothetical protein [Mucilaginibacter sp. L3T2-6]